MNPINCWRKFKRVLMLTWRRNNSSFQGKLSNSLTLVENWPLPYALVRVPEHHFFVVKRATTKDAESWCRKLGASLAVLGVANSAMLRDCRSNSWRQLAEYHFLAKTKTSVRRSRELYQTVSTVYLMLQ